MSKYLKNVPGITRESFAAALSIWYAEGKAAAMPDKMRKTVLSEQAPAYTIAMARAKLAAADYAAARVTLAEAGGKPAEEQAAVAEKAFFDALRALYAFSGVRVSQTDGDVLLSLFASRMDKCARVKVEAAAVNGEEFRRIRRAEAVKDSVFRAAAEALQAARLAEVNFVERAAEIAAEAAEANKAAAEKAEKAAETIRKKAEAAARKAEAATEVLRKAEAAAEKARAAAEKARAAADAKAEKAEKAAEKAAAKKAAAAA